MDDNQLGVDSHKLGADSQLEADNQLVVDSHKLGVDNQLEVDFQPNNDDDRFLASPGAYLSC